MSVQLLWERKTVETQSLILVAVKTLLLIVQITNGMLQFVGCNLLVAIWWFQFCNNCNSIAIVVIETILMFLTFLWFGFCLFSFLIWVKWPFNPNTLAQQFLALSQADVADTNEQRLQPFPKYRLKNPQSHTDWCLMGVNHVIATCIGTRDCHN